MSKLNMPNLTNPLKKDMKLPASVKNAISKKVKIKGVK